MIFDIKKVKITVSMPFDSVQKVRDAILNAGAGIIGNYTHCSIYTKCYKIFKRYFL